ALQSLCRIFRSGQSIRGIKRNPINVVFSLLMSKFRTRFENRMDYHGFQNGNEKRFLRRLLRHWPVIKAITQITTFSSIQLNIYEVNRPQFLHAEVAVVRYLEVARMLGSLIADSKNMWLQEVNSTVRSGRLEIS